MAKRHYDCTECGANKVVEGVTVKDAEKKAAWFARNQPVCWNCRRSAELAEAVAFAAGLDLPALTGTDAQIAYAEVLRAERVKLLHDALMPEFEPVGLAEEDILRLARRVTPLDLEMAVQRVSRNTDADWWISSKGIDPAVLIRNALATPGLSRQVEELARAVEFESVIRPSDPVLDAIVSIIVERKGTDSRVMLDLPVIHAGFRQLVKSYGYRWDREGSKWFRPVVEDDPHGGVVRVAAEIGQHLNSEDFIIRALDPDVLAAIRNGCLPEVRKRIDYIGSDRVSIRWMRVDGDFYAMAKKLTGARWSKKDQFVLVPVTSADGIRDFADRAGFVITDRATAAFDAFDAFRASGAVDDLPKSKAKKATTSFVLDKDEFPEAFDIAASLADDVDTGRWAD